MVVSGGFAIDDDEESDIEHNQERRFSRWIVGLGDEMGGAEGRAARWSVVSGVGIGLLGVMLPSKSGRFGERVERGGRTIVAHEKRGWDLWAMDQRSMGPANHQWAAEMSTPSCLQSGSKYGA